MDEHERGYGEGYGECLKTVAAMLDGGMSLAMIKEVVADELAEENSN